MAELSEYESRLIGAGTGSGRYASTYNVDLPPDSPLSIGGYSLESLYPEYSPEYAQTVRAGLRLGDQDTYVEPGVIRRESFRGPISGRTFETYVNPLRVLLTETDTPGGKVSSRGINLGPLTYAESRPEQGKVSRAVQGGFNLDPGRLSFEMAKDRQSVGYSTPLDLGLLELLAMKDPQALAAFLRWKLNF